ncbi:hypothetical protein BDA99DRAFT_169044 [Phascolomyces articulosus]|uniref:Uncharacterized protein n=1 Tax=Phascolomyces articulosus TaxID=60185 RepID=A0AAD5PB81_9FUNG|nr:hypothetical protein BDA99DRAFT_169044 [Phascolomyces articulosus]
MMASGWKLGFRPSKTLLGIFLEQMPKYPQFPRLTIELKDWPLLKSSSCKSYDWQLLLISLQFPTHLIKKIHPESQLSIYGTSSWATMLQNAHKLFKAGVKREYLRILLFDRSDDSIMNVDLYRYKRSQWITKFFLFGFLSPTQSSIPPPTEAFPRNSGGFMITDAENIIQNPSILTKISDAIDSLNKNPLTFSRWRFVLQDDIFTHLQARATTSKNAVKIQEAIVNLSILLSQNQCEVMRNWVVDVNSNDFFFSIISWMKRTESKK